MSAGLPVRGPLARYADWLHSFDLLVGSDVVYDHYHGQLANVCRAMLARPMQAREAGDAAAQTAGRAIFLLPDARPRLSEFVDGARRAGLHCRIEHIDDRCPMVRRLRRARV